MLITLKNIILFEKEYNGRERVNTKQNPRFQDEVSNSETVQLRSPTHSSRSAVTDFNDCVYLWGELTSNIFSQYKVSQVSAHKGSC